jgi:hypothetical protein
MGMIHICWGIPLTTKELRHSYIHVNSWKASMSWTALFCGYQWVYPNLGVNPDTRVYPDIGVYPDIKGIHRYRGIHRHRGIRRYRCISRQRGIPRYRKELRHSYIHSISWKLSMAWTAIVVAKAPQEQLERHEFD